MPLGMPLGAKIGLAIAVVAACVAGAVGGLVHHITAGDQLTAARKVADDQLLSAAYDYAAGRESGGLVDPRGLPGPVAAAVRGGRRVTYLQKTPKGPVLWAATQVSARHVLALRRPYDQERRWLAALDRSLLIAGAAATLLASLAGLGLGVRMGRRAASAARTAEGIADGDLAARVFPSGGDEIARLAASVNAMADALGARLEAERRVTADIAHELRTPVAGMVASASMLSPGPVSDLVRASARSMHRLVEDVLEVARLDAQVARPEIEPREVSALARRAVAELDGVEVRIIADTVADTDPRRVERILTNLAANALRHGAGPVVVEVDGIVVRVRDHGPGFPADLLAVLRTSGPQRFRTGAPGDGQGIGLGLTIATGQARVIGAGLTFGNAPDGGAEVVLALR